MKTTLDQTEKDHIEEIAQSALKQAKMYGIFPTSLDKLAYKHRLQVSTSNLSKVDLDYRPKNQEALVSALGKVRGVIDVLKNTIIVDQNSNIFRQRFTGFHEIGHGVLPWQRPIFMRQAYHLDSDETLSSSCQETLELEASYFSACVIFQCDIGHEIIYSKPLNREAIREVAHRFQVSFHATARRFMDLTPHRAVLLLLKEAKSPNGVLKYQVSVKQYFSSDTFQHSYPDVKWGKKTFDQETPFVSDAFNDSVTASEGLFFHSGMMWNYEYFSDQYTHFVLVSDQSFRA